MINLKHDAPVRVLTILLMGFALPGQSTDAKQRDAFTVPIHPSSQKREEVRPGGSCREHMASGPDYKLLFSGGSFGFYPLLGASHARNLPLRWTTVSIEQGTEGSVTIHHEPEIRPTPWRYEVIHGGVVEAYDLHADGVEQTFAFAQPLARKGDLVVTGRLETELEAEVVERQHTALRFFDSRGRAIVEYGAAWAFDATGIKTKVETSWDGEFLSLRVAADWLSRAAYPILIDPLTSTVVLDKGNGGVESLDLAQDPGGNAGGSFLVYSRVFAGGDTDTFGRVADPDFGNGVAVFADVAPTTAAHHPQVAYVVDAKRWVVVFQRDVTSPPVSSVEAYLHDRSSRTLNSGRRITLPRPAGTTARLPDVGGSPGGATNAVVVYQTDVTSNQTNTVNTETWAALLDAKTSTVAPAITIGHFQVGTRWDREHSTVVKMSDGGKSSWLVAWHEHDWNGGSRDDWDVNVAKIRWDGTREFHKRLGQSAHPWDKRFPQIAGGRGRFMITYVFGLRTPSIFGSTIDVQRFDWPDGSADPTMKGKPLTLATDSARPDFAFPRIAHDWQTRSHWTVSWLRSSAGDLFAARLGHAGGVVEKQTVFTSANASAKASAIAFAPDRGGQFGILFATDTSGNPVNGVSLLYPGTAINQLYGVGCGGAIGATSPYAGAEFYTVSLSAAKPSAMAALLLGVAADKRDLGGFGMPGCALNVRLPMTLPMQASASGQAKMTIRLPDSPVLRGNVYLQWVHVDRAANRAGAVVTRGLASRIR